MTSRISFFIRPRLVKSVARHEPRHEEMAEVDGNRTRRTGITRPSRFEGGGAHQAPGHLQPVTLPAIGRVG